MSLIIIYIIFTHLVAWHVERGNVAGEAVLIKQLNFELYRYQSLFEAFK